MSSGGQPVRVIVMPARACCDAGAQHRTGCCAPASWPPAPGSRGRGPGGMTCKRVAAQRRPCTSKPEDRCAASWADTTANDRQSESFQVRADSNLSESRRTRTANLRRAPAARSRHLKRPPAGSPPPGSRCSPPPPGRLPRQNPLLGWHTPSPARVAYTCDAAGGPTYRSPSTLR